MKKNNYSDYLIHEHNQTKHSHGDDNQSNVDYHEEHSSTVHSHDHASEMRNIGSKVLLSCFAGTLLFSIVEAIGGYITHSIALQSDAVHMMTDAAGLLIAYLANIISRRPATINLTFGYGKAEAIGALVNCVFTILLTLGLLIEVVARFFSPVEVQGAGLFIIAAIGLLVNGIVVLILSKSLHSLNTKAAVLHALGDLLGSAVAIFAGAIIYFTGFSMADPILSLVVIVLLIVSNYNLLKKSSVVLMAGVPEHLDYDEIGRDLEHIEGVVGVHDLHIWYMSANKAALSAHISSLTPHLWHKVLLDCQKMLIQKHNIDHITLQYEFDEQYFATHYCEVK